MKKRFKTRQKKLNIHKLILLLIIVYVSIYLAYNIIYNIYLSKLSNKEIINHIIENSKNNQYKSTFLDNYINPDTIIKNHFKIEEINSITVENKLETKPIVYIYSTHETESYQDKYLEVYNIKPTVKTMSYILKDYLEDYGIPTIVEEKSITSILKEHKWSYKYSYKASKIAAEETIKNNPSLKLIIDLHRDSSKLEKTLLEINNKKYARILFVIGEEHPNYQQNYNLSNNLKVLLEGEVPGITRGILGKSGEGVNGIYNQDLSSKSILIELGGQYNEIEELNNTIEVLAKVILKYTEGEI